MDYGNFRIVLWDLCDVKFEDEFEIWYWGEIF